MKKNRTWVKNGNMWISNDGTTVIKNGNFFIDNKGGTSVKNGNMITGNCDMFSLDDDDDNGF